MTNNSINVDFAQTEVQEIRLGETGAVEIILNNGTVVGFTDIGQGAGASEGYIFFWLTAQKIAKNGIALIVTSFKPL